MSKDLDKGESNMKTFLKILAWTGMAIFIFGAVLSFSDSCELTARGSFGLAAGHQTAFFLGILGLIFMIIGGLTTRPGHYWSICITAGLFHIISFFEVYIYIATEQIYGQVFYLLLEMSLIPGAIAIIEGIWLRIKENKTSGKQVFDGTV
jgi:hypothetical protein